MLLSTTVLTRVMDAQQPDLAPTPPMGWNSWDAYGSTIDEQKFRTSAEWVAAHLKPAGYEYVTIDEGWFDDNPPADGSPATKPHLVDQYGRLIPSVERFPSAADGKGFAPLADYVHSLGLKFGIHVLQGIPKAVVEKNSPIEGSTFHAKDAANPTAGCIWNTNNFDLQENAASQAYYDSIVRLYASWHVDLIKVDCISARPYKGEEIRMFHEAIAKSGRKILLSLSPGAAPLNEAANLAAYSQQWRISDDVWDVWQSTGAFPQGVNDQISRAAEWLRYSGPGQWPDADMLPLGHMGPAPGYLKVRESRLTHDEQRSMMNLWSIMRSPLVYGGDPAATDEWTLGLLTNPQVIAVDQHSHGNRSAVLTDALAVYTAQPADGRGSYVAVFNRADQAQEIELPWTKVGLRAGDHKLTDLWTKAETAGSSLRVSLPAHASTMLLVR